MALVYFLVVLLGIFGFALLVNFITGTKATYLKDVRWAPGELELWRDTSADFARRPRYGQAVVTSFPRLRRHTIVWTNRRVVVTQRVLFGSKHMLTHQVFFEGAGNAANPGDVEAASDFSGGFYGRGFETIAATAGGLLYIPYLLHFLVRLLMREADSGENLALCLWVVAVAKFCDVGALLTGLALGRHKMAPEISPKKTWEGAVGGVLISAGVGAGLSFLFSAQLPEFLTPLVAVAVAGPLAIIAIISDLIESAIKRRADTKDTGHLIPGIGGAFDLTDSLLLTAPVAYFIFLFLN